MPSPPTTTMPRPSRVLCERAAGILADIPAAHGGTSEDARVCIGPTALASLPFQS